MVILSRSQYECNMNILSHAFHFTNQIQSNHKIASFCFNASRYGWGKIMTHYVIGKIARSRQSSMETGKIITIHRLERPSDRRRLDFDPTRKYNPKYSTIYEGWIISYNILQRKYLWLCKVDKWWSRLLVAVDWSFASSMVVYIASTIRQHKA